MDSLFAKTPRAKALLLQTGLEYSSEFLKILAMKALYVSAIK
jgi:hypothetical protein